MKQNRFIPYGYTVRDGRTVIEHTEADIIKEIFEEYIKGASLKDIADNLTARKVPYTEKTNVWDKARIARILDNAKYTGSDEYDAIIDEDTFETAVSTKISRQTNTVKKECDGIAILRNRVRCESCGSLMVRKVCAKRKINESWSCTNDECGCRIRISDTDLLLKVTVLLNRIIENANLIIPSGQTVKHDSVEVAKYKDEINAELGRQMPSEEFIIARIIDIANRQYAENNSKQMITANIVKKRISLMKPQEEFNCAYFSDLVSYITLDNSGRVKLHTKTETEIQGEDENGGKENT